VRIELQRTPAGPFQSVAKVEADGSFVIPGIWPGRYRANVSVEDGIADSMRFGDREILGQDFDFDGTDAPLRLTVLQRGEWERITGTLTDASQHAVAGASLIFVPLGVTYSRRQRAVIRLTSTDQNGGFNVPGIPRGVYRVYAVEEPTEIDEAMSDPDFLKSQERIFPPVTVAATGGPTVKLVMAASPVVK
jgi:hypothetical protein